MTKGATISSTVLWGFDAQLVARGVEPHALARACDIPESVWQDRDVEVPLAAFVGLLQRGADASGDQAFGWSAGRCFDLRALGALGEAILAAPDLGSALATFAGFFRLVQSTSELRFEVDSHQARLSYRILDPDIWPRQQDAEFSLSIFLTLIRACLGPDWRPMAIAFEHGPSRPLQGWHESIGSRCEFHQASNTVTLPVGVLDRPMPARDGAAWRRQFGALRRALIDRNRSRAIADRVESALLAALGEGPVDQYRIATGLGLSCRSLHRKLEAEGTGFGKILQECRCRLARHRLARNDQSLSQIALGLGYSDQSAFARAFKRHSGMTPGEYRLHYASGCCRVAAKASGRAPDSPGCAAGSCPRSPPARR